MFLRYRPRLPPASTSNAPAPYPHRPGSWHALGNPHNSSTSTHPNTRPQAPNKPHVSSCRAPTPRPPDRPQAPRGHQQPRQRPQRHQLGRFAHYHHHRFTIKEEDSWDINHTYAQNYSDHILRLAGPRQSFLRIYYEEFKNEFRKK